jgi:hypothetical protein
MGKNFSTGRDGFLSFQPMDFTAAATSTFVHLFQYQTGNQGSMLRQKIWRF